uniref:Uncharacterized protein n=1 Tax=Chromera velia CCMP2878 TaxID=1169474 RepID=A0A0G4HFE8_9ALVE|eukprot:Cvel_26959.t1-p1 / transcript=Cvel_26959.t1 / gene=Cvel_26959 / organism=Chromera_velia_CCMP2878 / gene_product=hypothetical protein / transcript_product=hypothetical protein / location=Cvel_scaffold3286:16817-17678(-) / protein_length=67 / sequence_SO=supercontig / SO=protein_coding / is_pseudo=false
MLRHGDHVGFAQELAIYLQRDVRTPPVKVQPDKLETGETDAGESDLEDVEDEGRRIRQNTGRGHKGY